MNTIEQIDEAYKIVCNLSSGKINWRMSIPSQADDPDIAIGNALLRAKNEIKKITDRNVNLEKVVGMYQYADSYKKEKNRMDKQSCFNCDHKKVCWLYKSFNGMDQEKAEAVRDMCSQYRQQLPIVGPEKV